MKQFFVYILASQTRRLYVGVTSDLPKRIWQHKNGQGGIHTRRYKINQLVYFEEASTSDYAFAREKELKKWSRAKKIALIESKNPKWLDLTETL